MMALFIERFHFCVFPLLLLLVGRMWAEMVLFSQTLMKDTQSDWRCVVISGSGANFSAGIDSKLPFSFPVRCLFL
jgi:hypothetical protein